MNARGRIERRIERLGGAVLDGFDAAGELWRVFADTLFGVTRGRARRPRGEVVHQMYQIGNRSLVFVGVTLGFIGMVMIYQTCLQVNRITGDLSRVGPEFAKILVHDFGPTLTAMMLATRVGAGIAAEIGSMKVTEQIDALRMSGVAPIDYLIVPRFMASVVMMLVLAIMGAGIAFSAGGLTANLSFGVNPRVFFDPSTIEGADLIIGGAKCVAYGMAIPVISGFCGLRARGSSEGVGWATTAAVIGSSFAVIVLDFIISGIGFVVRM
jgi:phospholipid/cholesterol/gamma-HCH transport system permease protein